MNGKGNAWVRNGVSTWKEEKRGPWTTRHAVSRPKQTVFIESLLGAGVCHHLAIQICPTGFGKVLLMDNLFSFSNWVTELCWHFTSRMNLFWRLIFLFILVMLPVVQFPNIHNTKCQRNTCENPTQSQTALKVRCLYGHRRGRAS